MHTFNPLTANPASLNLCGMLSIVNDSSPIANTAPKVARYA
jgi:hypothetical protein